LIYQKGLLVATRVATETLRLPGISLRTRFVTLEQDRPFTTETAHNTALASSE